MSKEFRIYSKSNCHLCERMLEQLKVLIQGHECTVSVIDIGGDSNLEHRYGARIPVLVVDNDELSESKLDIVAVENYLK